MPSTVGKIQGQMLENDLLRDGVDLAFDTDLIFLDVNNRRVGINSSSPFRPLLVDSTINTTDLKVDSQTSVANFKILSNSIVNQDNDIYLFASGAGATVQAGGIQTDGISIDASGIVSLRSNESIEITAAGAGTINFLTNVEVAGSVHVTGDVTFDGNITIGSDNTDNVVIGAEVNSNINPDLGNTYNLGSASKKWNTLYTNLVNGSVYSTGGAVVGGVDLGLRQGNIWYVAVAGGSSNYGDHPNDPFDKIEDALNVATSGDTVYIYPGTYYELLPLVVPAGVTIKGHDIRQVVIKPDTASGGQNVFELNGQTTVSDLTIADFYYDSLNDTGYAFSFATGCTVTSRSPYIQNVTVLTKGSVTSASDPLGFDQGDAGKGALVDGSVVNSASNEASMLFHSVTFITPGVDALTMTNGVRVEWLNSFTYFANRGLYATQGTGRIDQDGSTIRYGAEIRSIGSANVYGNYGAEADGANTLMYLINHNFAYIGNGKDSINDTSTVIEANEVVELNNGKIYYQSIDQTGNFKVGDIFKVDSATGEITFQSVVFSSTSNLTVTDGVGNTSYIDADEVTTGNIKISGNTIQSTVGGMTFTAYDNEIDITSNLIGTSLTTENLASNGNTTIGNNLSADYIDFNARVNSSLIPQSNLLTLGTSSYKWQNLYSTQVTLDSIIIDTDTIRTSESNSFLELAATGTASVVMDTYLGFKNNTISSFSNRSIEFDPDGTGEINLQKDTVINGTLVGSGPVILKGNTSFGLLATGVYLNGSIQSDLIPNVSGTYDFGLSGATYRNTFVSNFVNDTIEVNDNYIRTTVSNEDLELRANGTGSISVTDSLELGQNFTIYGITNLQTTNITGTLTLDSLVIQNNLSAFAFNNGDIYADDNFITTTVSNSNLELRAAGAGVIHVDQFYFNNNSITINSINNDFNIQANGTGKVQLLSNTDVTGDLFVTGNIDVAGNVQIGDQIIDSIATIAQVTSDIIPATANQYSLGSLNRTWKNLYTSHLTVDNIEINSNYITTTVSNSDLELRANGTGGILLDQTLKFSNSTISNNLSAGSESDRSIIFTPYLGKNVVLQSNKALQIPIGTNATRTLSSNGEIRFNSSNLSFEGQIPAGTKSLNNLFDLDRNTGITAELTPGTNDDTIRFYTNGTVFGTITSQAASFNKILVDELEFNNNIIRTVNTNANIELDRSGTGVIKIKDNFTIVDNIVTNTTTDAATQIVSTGSGFVKFDGTGAVRLPHGTDAQKPVAPPVGMIRYNTSLSYQEVYNGTAWVPVGGGGATVTEAEMELIGDLFSLIFG